MEHSHASAIAALAMVTNLFAALFFTVTTVNFELLCIQLATCAAIGGLIVIAWLAIAVSRPRVAPVSR
ncbi:hypothetical protein [Cupriavidus basilensis]|uniref:hypothetical protein n=1 Tax=Cupriavidus basilensis TaxID=68895 RepID=UPI0007508CC9|nr:hypothetical protein [Cupriavidus basilensis]